MTIEIRTVDDDRIQVDDVESRGDWVIAQQDHPEKSNYRAIPREQITQMLTCDKENFDSVSTGGTDE